MKSARHEGPPTLRLVTSRREKGVPKVTEEELVSIGETKEWKEGFNEQMFLVGMAQRFLEAAKEFNQKRGDPIALAAIQNTFARAMHAGYLPNWEKFKRDFNFALNAFVGDDDPMIEDTPISRYATTMLDGIETNVGVVYEMERAFIRRPLSPESRQLIATSDRLDASSQIDLVEVLYHPAKEATLVDRVRFVQVKRAVQPAGDVAKMFQAHERFMRSLLSEQSYRAEKRTLEERRAAELLKRQFSLEDVRAKTEAVFKRMEALADQPVEDGQIERVVASAALPVAVLKTWFADRDPHSREVARFLLEAAGVAPARVAVLGERLTRWATEHPASSAEMAAVIPETKSAASVIGAAHFESVVVHGGKIEKQTLALPPGERKALTAA